MLLFGLLGAFFFVALIYFVIYVTTDDSKQKDTTDQDYPYTKKNKF
jgi:hypothetical protein